MTEQNASDLISLPQGGGALAGIGETFQPDPHTGTGNLSVPLELPPGRHGFQPSLALSYSTGSPNGPFGLGWALSVPQVRRKTSKGVPHYDERDVFVLSGAEDLVRVPSRDGSARYRPRTETGFARISHVTRDQRDYWEVWSKDGLRSRYGTPRPPDAAHDWADPAVITAPNGSVFAWLISETVDLCGNRIVYRYDADPAGTGMRHLAELRYADYGDPAAGDLLVSVRVLFDERPDPFSDRRPGFELRTSVRAKSIETWMQAPAETRARSVDLTYADELGAPTTNNVSLLARITVSGHDDQTGQSEQLPPLEFGYTCWRPERAPLQPLGKELPAVALGTPGLDLVDLFGDGLPSLLQLNGASRYWRNRGGGDFDSPRPLRNAPAGVSLSAAGVQLADMDGDGRPDLVESTPQGTRYWPLAPPAADEVGDAAAGFDPAGYVASRGTPTVSLSDASVRLVDLDGDGRMDVLRAGERMQAACNNGHGGFDALQSLPPRAPKVSFNDPRIRLADMTGDGLTDIVLLHDRNVSYWPNLGRGNWGTPVVMANPPHFDDGAQYDITGFDPRRLLLGDVDGDGAADLVYIGDGHVTVWINQAGNAFAAREVIPGTPRVTNASSLRLIDLLGSGIVGILWSADATRPRLRHAFLDLTGGSKPYLLNSIDNHRGAITRIEYATSSHYALADRAQGRRWRTTLPFPVQVVARVTVTDHFSHSTLTSEYDYHHGYWDGADREFRGFARVDQRDAQTFIGKPDAYHSPPTETRTWFHVGPVGPEFGDWAPLDLGREYWAEDPPLLGRAVLETLPDTLSRGQRRDACRALRGSLLRTEHYALDGDEFRRARPYTVSEHQYEVTLASDPPPTPPPPATGPQLTPSLASTGAAPPAAAVLAFFPHQIAERTSEWERGDEPRTRLKWTGGYDAYGRAHSTLEVAVPRGRDPRQHDDHPTAPYHAVATAASYATRDDDRYICDRRIASARYEIVNDGRVSASELRDSLTSGSGRPARLLAYSHSLYDGKPLGKLGDWGLVTSEEQLALTAGQLARAWPGQKPGGPLTVPPYLTVDEVTPADGLRAEYFADTQLNTLAVVRAERTVNLRFAGCAPDPVLDPRGFSVRWTGTLRPRYSETYNILAERVGGVRVWLDDRLLLDDWADTGGAQAIPIALTAEQAYQLKVEFVANTPGAHVRLMWSSATQQRELLPSGRLAPPPWGVRWTAEYPAAFRSAVPPGAGYRYQRGDEAAWDGYYRRNERHYDVQDTPVGGRGLLVWERDALGYQTTIAYDEYALLASKITDAVGLTRTARHDYRLLKPTLLTDPNGNHTAIAYTPLGLPKSIAIMGKQDEQVGDLPDHPGTVFSYGLTAYDDSPSERREPLWVHTSTRIDSPWTLLRGEAEKFGRSLTPEEIAALLSSDEPGRSPERFVQRREHSDGFGRLVQGRVQADDLVIDELGVSADSTSSVGSVVIHAHDPVAPRVVVSGWQAYDNKGRVVDDWEPFFDEGWDYREPVSALLGTHARKVTTYYDAVGRAVRTVWPDGSEQWVIPGIPFDLKDPRLFTPTPWATYIYDANDNAGRTHPDESQPWRDHWNTPTSTVEDALGRLGESIERTAPSEDAVSTNVTQNSYDGAGNLLEVVDPLHRMVSRATYDLLGRIWASDLLDAGATRVVLDPLGGQLEERDSKGALQLGAFDEVHRPVRRWMRDRPSDRTTLREVTVYGDQLQTTYAGEAHPDPLAHNLLGRVYDAYDEAGRLRTPRYDFAGRVVIKQQQVLSTLELLKHLPAAGGEWAGAAYQVDWEPAESDSPSRRARDLLDTTVYESLMTYDALGRLRSTTAPRDATGHRATLEFTYNPLGALIHLELRARSDAASRTYVERIVYNARGQRLLCLLGNGVMTRFLYDSDTFRLRRMRSERSTPMEDGWRGTPSALQDHIYGYDQVGNIWTLTDTTPGCGIPPESDRLRRAFAYDALYRLIAADGREADIALTLPPWLDRPPGPDITKVRPYREHYTYDRVGNLQALDHTATGAAAGGSYTRTFTIGKQTNQLEHMAVGSTLCTYQYDSCGNLTRENASRHLEWNYANRLAAFRTQASNNAEPSTYVQCRYNSSGQRILKVVRDQGNNVRTTVYHAGIFERLTIGIGHRATHHDSLRICDDVRQVVLLRIGTPAPGDPADIPRTLYQLGDHTGSTEVVLDSPGHWISREEFLPYGETSFGGYAKKRFRFTAKEREEESSLYYHHARYYAPWLARWTSADPGRGRDGPNLYSYGRSSPVTRVDPSGRQSLALTQPAISLGEEWVVTPHPLEEKSRASLPQVHGTPREETEQRSIPEEHVRSVDNLTAGELSELMESNPRAAQKIFVESGLPVPPVLSTPEIEWREEQRVYFTEMAVTAGIAGAAYGGSGLFSPIRPVPAPALGVNVPSSAQVPSQRQTGNAPSVYFPRTEEGAPVALPQRRVNGVDIPLPDARAEGAAHTVLGGRKGTSGDIYRQSATFPEPANWPKAADDISVPFGRVDWTSHPGLPGAAHANPHVHPLVYDPATKQWVQLPGRGLPVPGR